MSHWTLRCLVAWETVRSGASETQTASVSAYITDPSRARLRRGENSNINAYGSKCILYLEEPILTSKPESKRTLAHPASSRCYGTSSTPPMQDGQTRRLSSLHFSKLREPALQRAFQPTPWTVSCASAGTLSWQRNRDGYLVLTTVTLSARVASAAEKGPEGAVHVGESVSVGVSMDSRATPI